MGIPRIDTGPMTIEEFYAFTDARPDGEKWELIDGEPVLNAAPSELHQLIPSNIIVALAVQEPRLSAGWKVLLGIGARVSRTSRPEPDVMILPKPVGRGEQAKRDTADAVVLFEIMSPSTATRDLKWKRIAYASLPALTHYVVIAHKKLRSDLTLRSRHRFSDDGVSKGEVACAERAAILRDACRRRGDDTLLRMRPALFHTRRVGMPVETQDAVDVVVFARDRGFREQRLKSLDDLIEFPTLGSVLPLSEIYYDIDFG